MDSTLLARISGHLNGFTYQTLPGENLRPAAVAVVLTEAGLGPDLAGLPQFGQWQADPAVILTRRAGLLRAHAGQWAFPGGRVDPGETLVEAALRELREEIGLTLTASNVLGRLDDYATRSGFLITPIVVWAGAAREIRPNPGEVGSVHRIPVQELLRQDAPRLEPSTGAHPVLRMPVGHASIAAPTAAILYQFREVCIAGRHTRVAHYDQPRFAWK